MNAVSGSRRMQRVPFTAALLAAGLLLVACGPLSDQSSSDADTTTTPTADGTPTTDAPPPSGLEAALGGRTAGLPDPLVPLFELRSGGPPPDGIPPIDEPVFAPAPDIDFLADNEAVLALEINGEHRAYPVQIMLWHEIVNDTVGGVPVAVTYCPLCNSALTFDRRVEGQEVTFGTSGLLWNSALVMYDRQTETLWSHFTGQGIVGVHTGVRLERYPIATVPWASWRDAHPDALVLTRDTGSDRRYGQNPYPGYDDVTSRPFLFEGEVDGRYTAMTRVVGLGDGDTAVAVPLTVLRESPVLTVDVGPRPVVVWWQEGTASPLDDEDVAAGDDIGATVVFGAVVDGRPALFTLDGDHLVDDATGTRWNRFGVAVDGPFTGSRLPAVEHLDTFWFAWSTFQPTTTVVHGAPTVEG